MTSADRKTCIQSLHKLEGLSVRFGERLSAGDEAIAEPFPQFRAALGTAEEKFQRERSRVAIPGALAVWDSVLSGHYPIAEMSSLTVDRLCGIPQVAMSQQFLSFIQTENRRISEWGLVGLVRSYHKEWSDLLNRFSVVEVIRSRIIQDVEPRSPRVRVWKAQMRCLVDTNDVDNLSLEAVNGRLSSGHLVHRFGIDEDSAFMSAVIATGIRRICQKHRPTSDDVDFLAEGLLGYRYFRLRDLGRVISNSIVMNHGRLPTKLRSAVETLTSSHPALGPLPENRARWLPLVDQAAITIASRWVGER